VISSTKIVRDTSTEFPVITLCNSNFFNTPSGKQYLKDLDFEKSSQVFQAKKINEINRSKIKLNQLRLVYAQSTLYKNKTLLNDFDSIRLYGSELKDMMFSCYFSSEPCNYTDFEYFFDIKYGNCYKYNSGLNGSNQNVSVKQVITSGDSSGLQLGLYIGQEDKNYKITSSSGIYLAIHNKSFKGSLSSNGFNIPTGIATNIGNFNFYFHSYYFL